MKKFQVSIDFSWDEDFMTLVPSHRVYINSLINKNIIEYYAVSMEQRRTWITINADDKQAVQAYLVKSPLHKYWTYEIAELFVLDGHGFRLPALQLN